jgi:hypothetical protein
VSCAISFICVPDGPHGSFDVASRTLVCAWSIQLPTSEGDSCWLKGTDLGVCIPLGVVLGDSKGYIVSSLRSTIDLTSSTAVLAGQRRTRLFLKSWTHKCWMDEAIVSDSYPKLVLLCVVCLISVQLLVKFGFVG